MMSRSRTRVLAAAVAVTAALGALQAPVPAEAEGRTLHVGGTSADDANPGTRTSPFATIARCAEQAEPGDTCLVHAGTYRETVTPPSGTDDAPIIFRAAGQVTISGADPVSGWTQDEDGVWSAPAELAAQYSTTKFPLTEELWANQVFTGTDSLTEAQFPNAPGSTVWDIGAQKISDLERRTGGTTGTITDDELPAGDLTGSVIYFTGGWTAISGTVTASGTDSLDYEVPTVDGPLYPSTSSQDHFRLVGQRAFLDAPGEWFYDGEAGRLLMLTEDGQQPTDVTAKQRNYAFDLRAASNVEVHGFDLFATSIITGDESHDVTLDRLDVSYPSTWQTAQYDPEQNFNGAYAANHKEDSGLVLHGRDNTLSNSIISRSMGNGVSLSGQDHEVTGNWVHDVAYGGTYAAPISVLGGSHDLLIAGNTLNDAGRDGINLHSGDPATQNFRDVRITGNDIYNFARISYDLGGIYTAAKTDFTGSRMDHNWIHDPVGNANGFHLDLGAYGMVLDHNVVWGLSGNGGFDGGSALTYGGSPDPAWPHGGKVKAYNNTLIAPEGGKALFDYFRATGMGERKDIRNNLVLGAVDIMPGGIYDHNLSEEPGFVAADLNDYRLQDDSPALGAGVTIPGITESSDDSADIGAYERGADWVPGSDLAAPFTAVRATSPTGQGDIDAVLTTDGPVRLTTTFRNLSRVPVRTVSVALDAPDGWTARSRSTSRIPVVTGPDAFDTDWTLTAPEGTEPGRYRVPVTVTYRLRDGSAATASGSIQVLLAQLPPTGETALSDLDPASSTNAWGPVEKDQSNGESGSGDGRPLTINGTTYAKGFGTNATSDILFYLGGSCRNLTTDVGIDDEISNTAKASFQILGDEEELADSGPLTATDPARTLGADLTDVTWLRLHVDPEGAETADHGDWANPRLTCS